MKTINVNLVGELHMAPEYNKKVIRKDNLNARTKIFVVIFLVVILVTFILGFSFWLFTNTMCGKYRPELQKLQASHRTLKSEEQELAKYNKNLKNALKIAKFKLLAKEQINQTFIPWSEVLKDLASKIPRDIIITDVKKTTSSSSSGVNKLNITGMVPANKSTIKPITTVSFLILNINEDKNSFLGNAEIKKVEYNPELNIYEFEVSTNVYSSKEKN